MVKEIPKWTQDEIKNAKFGKPESLTRTGYILEIYDKDMKIDVQLYEVVEDGRKIIEGMNLPKKIKPSELMKGVVYEFTFSSSKAPLSKKVVEFLRKEMEIDMDAIYQFELTNLELMDVDSDSVGSEEPEE
ncbi:MAG: hypothetical protein AUH84_04140 [Thaumarchaeota archaeon 13_1_40CM_4_38_7]|nr:MAG: hypothetical protein AUH84_04140 [Thaumarchaeota archaeon 13_1_40CM_4_38_7]OLC92075.1 MAG: hypothetical protein AUI92_06035 [Thaumarchaeota archaeon 13_1_40CM_3_38_6]OLD40504.1 MAG: hypothetical protein AUI60_04565 [Thaumarchaeota archaeon 13_1_40CM_2_39_4]TLY07238.1 MAG: hypothetical protein E6K83_06105 [Nitrososphaerota archaeon]